MEPQEAVKAKCLRCDREAKGRGLCSTHHSQYHKETKGMTDAQLAAYDAALVEAKLLTPPKRRGPKPDDPYAEIAAKIKAEETPESLAADVLAQADAAAAQYAAKKQSKATKKPKTAKKRGA